MLNRITNYLFIVGINAMLLIGLSSCNQHSKLEKQMEGLWGIDLCMIDGEDYAKTAFNSNTITFEEKNKCRLPQFYYDSAFRGQQYAKWELVDSVGQMFIVIEEAKNILSNTYTIEFMYNKQKNLHKIYLENNNTKIKMTKALANWN